MTGQFVNPSWMPHSVSEAAKAGDATAEDLVSGHAWSHLLDALGKAAEVVSSNAVARNPADLASGFRHLLVLLSLGADQALRADPDPVLAVSPSGVDNVYKWGMDCPDCIYTGAPLRGGETYRIRGNRGSARYVGLQSMAGMASSANVLLDELDLGPGGEVDLMLSAEPQDGNWLSIAENATILVVRHFFYDWDSEVASSLSIERVGASGAGATGASGQGRKGVARPREVAARQLIALGDFVLGNLDFFLQFSRPESPNAFCPARRHQHGGGRRESPRHRLVPARAGRGAGGRGHAARRPLLELLDREPLVGNHRLARHQSSLNGHQAVVDDDGILRVVLAHQDPGIANWLDTAGHSAGPVILRCVRTESAPVPESRWFGSTTSPGPCRRPHGGSPSRNGAGPSRRVGSPSANGSPDEP